jgi:hypothetical protein
MALIENGAHRTNGQHAHVPSVVNGETPHRTAQVFGWQRPDERVARKSEEQAPIRGTHREKRVSAEKINVLTARRDRIAGLIDQRTLRVRHFDADLFADPAWDILLDLALAVAEDRRVSVSNLCLAAAVPTTTAHSWILRLTAEGLLIRTRDRFARRRCWVTMTEKAEAAVIAYLDDISA